MRTVRLAPIVLLAATLASCSTEQVEHWLEWYRDDPTAAVDWAVDECGELCSDDWDGDGVVEPEPSAASEPSTDDGWSDSTVSESDADVGWGECSQWMGDALDAGWTSEQWGTLNWIMARESGCDPGAQNPSGATGLLQIMPMWADDCGGSSSDLFSPWFNLACGLHVYHAQGWSAWSVWG